MTWLNFLKDCAEINKMLNALIKSLATIHLATPPPGMTGRIIRGETGLFQTSRAPAPYDGADHSEEKHPAVIVLEMKTNHE